MTNIDLNNVPPQGWKGLSLYWKNDLVAALSVSLVALPLGLGIAVAGGAPPVAGLISVIVGGLVTTFFRGSYVGINGPANVLVVIALVASESLSLNGESGFRYALAAFVISGIIQVILGFFKMGKLGNLVPAATIHGMLAAIGFIIIGTQLHHALGMGEVSFSLVMEQPEVLLGINPFIGIISVLSLIILFSYSRIHLDFIKLIPAPMWVLILAVPLFFVFEPLSRKVGVDAFVLSSDYLVQLPPDILDALIYPDFSRIGEPIFWFVVFLVTLVLSLESLVISKAVDKLDPYKRRTNLDKDLVGIGLATIVSACIGGLPVTAVIARSSVNINNGAKTSWSNFMHGLIVLICVVAFSSFIQKIPLAALAAILIYTGYMLTSPDVYKSIYLQGWEQLLIVLVTLAGILLLDLVSGLFIGIFFTVWLHYFKSRMSPRLFFRYLRKPYIKVVKEKKQTSLFKIKGIINFANILPLQQKLDRLSRNENVIMDFSHSRLVDSTVLEFLHEYAAKFNRNGGDFHFTGLDVHKTSSHHPYALHVLETPRPRKSRLTRRQLELKELAERKQWAYDPEIEWNVSDLQSFIFFKSKPVEYIKNKLLGHNELQGLHWKICDISFINAFVAFENYRITAEILQLPFEIPAFSLEEESFVDRMSLLAEQKDIDFEEYKNFSKKFMLQGQDEEAIRKLFTPELVRFFERGEIYHLESNGKALLIFRHLRLTSPQEIVKMVTYSQKLTEKMQEAALCVS